jgi:inhibitor of cysteine peptidase
MFMRGKSMFAAILAVTLLVAPAMSSGRTDKAAADSGIQVVVRGKTLPLPAPAVLDGGTTLVPFRQVAEALGATVGTGKDPTGKLMVILTKGDVSATLVVGRTEMKVGNRAVRLPAAPRLREDTVMVPLRAISEALGTVVAWDGLNKIVRIDDPKLLPTVGTTEKLQELLKSAAASSNNGILTLDGFASADDAGGAIAVPTAGAVTGSAAEAPAAAEESSKSAAEADHSTTNVQVEGVDEADWAKTDGRFIYQLSGTRVLIASIADSSAPKLAATLEYSYDKGFYPQQLYVSDGRLVVVGQQSEQIATPVPMPMPVDIGSPEGGPAEEPASSPDTPVSSNDAAKIAVQIAAGERVGILPYYPVRTTTKAMVYEIGDAGTPDLVREIEAEGSYLSSRMIGSALYLVTNKYNDIYPMLEKRANGGSGSQPADPAAFEPVYRDTAVSDEQKTIPLDELRYFPGSPESSTMLIGAVDLDSQNEMQVSAYLGSGQTIYASTKNLYVAISRYMPSGDTYKQETQLHKFRLDHGSVMYLGEGTVPGTILNQFAMDEHEGYFRIATTKGDMWASGDNLSKNNIYVLDEQLKQVGALEDLAPGERIYSTRFMGGRAYMVTFRNVDPLFAIDLRNPAKPALLGQLKIPGYSDYLHPYDENHLIGFGKETVEVPSKGMGPDATMAFYQGMKIALFDVTDVTQPKEKFKEIIGDRGTHSELLYDHKALLFDKSKGLMAFPVELMEIKDKRAIEQDGAMAYGQFTYQGAYVYRIDPEQGFTLRGRISHLSDDDLAKTGYYGYDYAKAVRRILYANDTLYTLSERMLKANALDSLKEQGALTYPAPPEQKYPGTPDMGISVEAR